MAILLDSKQYQAKSKDGIDCRHNDKAVLPFDRRLRKLPLMRNNRFVRL